MTAFVVWTFALPILIVWSLFWSEGSEDDRLVRAGLWGFFGGALWLGIVFVLSELDDTNRNED